MSWLAAVVGGTSLPQLITMERTMSSALRMIAEMKDKHYLLGHRVDVICAEATEDQIICLVTDWRRDRVRYSIYEHSDFPALIGDMANGYCTWSHPDVGIAMRRFHESKRKQQRAAA